MFSDAKIEAAASSVVHIVGLTSMSPIYHWGLIQSGPTSQSAVGWLLLLASHHATSSSFYTPMKTHPGRTLRRQKGTSTSIVRAKCQWTTSQGVKSGIKGKSDASATPCVWVMSLCVCAACVVLCRPCVWPYICVSAPPQRTWAAGVETSAGNTMVQSSWWVPPTMSRLAA